VRCAIRCLRAYEWQHYEWHTKGPLNEMKIFDIVAIHIQNTRRLSVALIICVVTATFSACSMTTLPWPDLSISGDEADGALSKNEQSQLEKILSTNQKNHRAEAEREIEGR